MSDFGSQPRMNRGRSRGDGGRYTPSPRGRSSRPPFQPNGSSQVGNGWRHRGFPSPGHNVEPCSSERKGSGEAVIDGISKRFATMSPLNNPHRHDDSAQSTSSCVGNLMQLEHNSSIKQPFSLSASGFKQQDSPSSCPSVLRYSPIARTFLKNESIPAVNSGFGKRLSEEINQSEQSSKEQASNGDNSENHDQLHIGFDICQARAGNVFRLNTPLHVKNKERRNEIKRSMEVQNIKILSDGMVLLKGFISLLDQVTIVNTCRKLGNGPGGFYQPGYNDGAKLHLKMMCLGKNWDPETGQYGDKRSCDGAKPPMIPDELHHLVQKAIHHSRSYLEKQPKCKNIDDVLPSMSPDICIVNFYTISGKLGLHQDKDESQESIKRRLPVVSFSIGDGAEFLYSNERDPEKADKVILESGDVLIFGGKSRLIYHGVSSIKQNTASPSLLEQTNLKPGRLNLTFRQY